jgi:fructoselysine-6-P-deglycase FrlB-like protein
VDAALFLTDLERKPATMRATARALGAGEWRWPIASQPRRVVLIGMGSSLYAAQVAALRLRAAGVMAVAESGSATRTLPVTGADLVVGISAGGSSLETHTLLATCSAAQTVALTNTTGSAITADADSSVDLLAGPELGGVACRSYTHTLIALLQLEQQLIGDLALAERVRRAADATSHLLDTRADWLNAAAESVDGPHGSWMVAPLERGSSAAQSALMMREGPRRPAVGCETGDWSHVDVYLTRTLDYRAVVFPGSRWDEPAAAWLTKRKSRVLAIGGHLPGAALTVRYPGDDDPIVQLLTETTVVELIAAHLWSTTSFPEEAL